MSGINNSHKLNGNLIVSGATTVTSVTAAAASVKTNTTTTTTNTTTNKGLCINNNTNNLIDKQQLSQQNNKLSIGQQQQQQLRRSLLPSVAATSTITTNNQNNHNLNTNLHNHQQAPSSGTISTAAVTSTIAAYPNQLQTVATIHQQHTQLSPTSQSTAQQQQDNKSLLQQQVRRSLHSLHAHTLKAPANNIPPRYQPPPQPQSQPQTTNSNISTIVNGLNGGILKHLHYNTTTNTAAAAAATTTTTTTAATANDTKKFYFGATDHINLKYPPDIPQLSTVYIPDTYKTQQQQQQQQSGNRYIQQQQRLQQQLPLQQRLRNNNNNLQQQQQDKTQQQDMLKFVRKPDQDHPSPNASVTSSSTGIPTATGRLTAEQNRQLQSLINELRALKEQNQRLLEDNQELRDLCCFLDDDRQKGRKLAREWQRFGRYTASVMRQEVAAYQNKLRQLDDKQQELITDNLELKELCLYLDEERLHVASSALCTSCGAATSTRNARDDGDGSSSSTNADEQITALRNYERQLPDMQLRATLNDQTLQYVRSLERRIQQLEEERLSALTPTAQDILVQQQQQQVQQQQQQQQQSQVDNLHEPISGRPEAVVRALQVLEVREQLERDRLINLGNGGANIEQLDDGEKALVREMCNVVWRKLEGSPNAGVNTLEPL